MLAGPPGIGKTRLAEELAQEARQSGQRVLWGRAVQEEGAPPLWPWRRILGAVGGVGDGAGVTGEGSGGSARLDDPAGARFRAAAAAADALTAAADAGDLLVVLEDMHWADHASLFLLREVAAELPGSRLLVLVTCRDAAGDAWRALLGELARLPGAQVLRLAPLGRAAVADMLGTVGLTADPGLADLVHARSEGNPLYVVTLARLLAARPGIAADADAVAQIAGGSAEVNHLVSSLLRDLDDGCRGLLAAASVLGTDFSCALAVAVRGTSQEVTGALAAAEAGGLLTRQPGHLGSWRFSHALIRDGIYASLGEEQRSALHARAAATRWEPLACEAPERGGEVAAHLLRAAPDRAALRRAADWASAAAEAATSALAFEDAACYLATALAAAEAAGTGGTERAELLIALATAQYRAGLLSASLQHAVTAADAAEPGGRLNLVAEAALVVRGVGHPPVAATLIGLCDRALADPRCPRARQARLLAQRACAFAELRDLRAADADSVAAMAAAAGTEDPATELEAIRARVAALPAPQHCAERLRLGARAIELAAAARQSLTAVLAHTWRIDAAYQLLDLETVDAEIGHITQLAESTRLPLARWHLLRQQASRAALAGQLTTARDRSRQADRLSVRLQDPSGQISSCLFAIWLAVIRGDPAEIPADLSGRMQAAPPLPVIRASHAMALFATGRTEEARAAYETLRHLPATGNRDLETLRALMHMTVLILAFGDRETADAAYGLLSPQVADTGATGTGSVFVGGSLHRQLGQLAALLGRTDQALGHFAQALTINTRIGARPFVALTRLDWAGTLRTRAAHGDFGQAQALARQAAAEARRLDMPGPAARAERLARDLEQEIQAADPLTRREREIAALVSAGLTNRAIADQLVLSERTIEGHIRNTLAKLQLTNRTELATWALQNAAPDR